jgi:hypothetical protein
MKNNQQITVEQLESQIESKYKTDGYWAPPLDRIVVAGGLVVSQHRSLRAAERSAAKHEDSRILAWDGYGQPPSFR